MRSWVDVLDFSKISDEDRVRLLEHALVRFGKARVQEVLGVDRSMLWRIMNKKVRLVDDRLRRLLTLYTEDEFREVVGIKEVLRLAGVYRDDGTLNYSVALQIISLASRDEYLKQALLRFTVENFKEDLKKMLGIVMSGTTLTWTEDFEEFLRTRKKRRRVTSNDTITYYKSLFKKFLEGKELIEEVVNHENKWVRNVFRHHVQYLVELVSEENTSTTCPLCRVKNQDHRKAYRGLLKCYKYSKIFNVDLVGAYNILLKIRTISLSPRYVQDRGNTPETGRGAKPGRS
ncbi:MAG: zinc ribbon domain-containing protein [Zestosphaera sp.]